MSRIGLGRHGLIEDDAGDPLDGLVNLFDVGVILAIAFLIAGLGISLDARAGGERHRTVGDEPLRSARGQTIPSPKGAPRARGRGEPVGRVYRLPDGRLVLVRPHLQDH